MNKYTHLRAKCKKMAYFMLRSFTAGTQWVGPKAGLNVVGNIRPNIPLLEPCWITYSETVLAYS
jgi:hypothetical protein